MVSRCTEGPMFYADTVGLSDVVAAMNKYSGGRHGEFCCAFGGACREGKTFN
jgi:3-hydroxyacyl-CoA dehydrogenase